MAGWRSRDAALGTMGRYEMRSDGGVKRSGILGLGGKGRDRMWGLGKEWGGMR